MVRIRILWPTNGFLVFQLRHRPQPRPGEDEVREALQKLDPLWDELFPAEQERVVRLLVKEAVLSPDGLDIRTRTNGLRSVVAELRDGGQAVGPGDGDTLDVHIPMELRRRGGRKEIILPPDAATTAHVRPRSALVVALAWAYHWQRMIESGEVKSLDELAARHGVDRSYIGRILRLSTLAPDIMQVVVDGAEPSGLSPTRLRRDIPVNWAEQRRLLASSHE